MFFRDLFVGLCLSTAVLHSADEWLPEGDVDRYREVLDIMHKAEPYTGFLAAEDQVILAPDEAYYIARCELLKTLRFEHPQIASPKKAVNEFFADAQKLGWFTGDKWLYHSGLISLGNELITDRVPFSADIEGVEVHRDVTFVEYDGFELKLDLFVPPRAQERSVPCIIFIHGGGWAVHKRAWFEGHAQVAAREGFASASIDYRMLPAVTPIECVMDAKAAVRWIRENASEYGIDPNRIGACGASAGAHLTAMLATTADVACFDGDSNDGEVSSRIQAAVGFATPALSGRRTWPIKNESMEIPDWFEKVSPYRYVTPDDAPMKFIHGTDDTTVSLDESKDMHRRFQEAGVMSEIEVIDGAKHVFYMNEDMAMKAVEFFKRVFEVN